MSRPPAYKTARNPLPAICERLRANGGRLDDACGAAGVATATVLRWMADDDAVNRLVEGAQEWGRRFKDEGPGGHPSSPSDAREAAGLLASAPPRPALGPGMASREVARDSGSAAANRGSEGEPSRAPTQSQDRWARIHAEAAALGPGLFGYLLWLEARIAAHNEKAPPWDRLPAMPEPIRDIFREFVESGKQELDILGGRGLGKTTLFCRFTLIECLFAPPVVNGGEIAIWAELAQDMDAAQLALGVLEKLLQIAGFRRGDPETDGEFKTMKQERGRSRIKFRNAHNEQIEIRVYPGTVEALSGPTLKGARHDEEQKWRANAKDGTSSAEDVLDAEGGAFRGRPHAHLYRMSSAYSKKTPHHRDTHGIVVDANGNETRLPDPDTRERMVARIGRHLELARAGFEARAQVSNAADAAEIRAFAASLTSRSPEIPSWFNPTLDPRTLKARSVLVFLREYGSKTADGGEEGDFFDPILLDAAVLAPRPSGSPDAVFAAIDTGAKKNPAALAIVGRWDVGLADQRSRSIYAPILLRSWKPTPGHPLDLRLVVLPQMARLCHERCCTTWASDGFASDQVDLVAAEYGIRVEYVATSEAYRDVYQPVADGLGRGECALSGCDGAAEAVAQMRRVSSEAQLGASGARVAILVPEDAGGEHGDLGVALVRALAAAGCGKVATASWGVSAVAGRYASSDPRAGSFGRMRA